MTSESEPCEYCDFTYIQDQGTDYENRYNSENNIKSLRKSIILQEQSPYVSSICSASYIKQASDEWDESDPSDGHSYSYVKVIENTLGEYCDLGIQPHNTYSQEYTVSLNNINILDYNEDFSFAFSQGINTQEILVDYSEEYSTANHLCVAKNKVVTQYTALVPYKKIKVSRGNLGSFLIICLVSK